MPGVVQLAPAQPGVLTPLPVEPPAGGAPFTNFSYALQWLTFGLIALVALGYFIRLEILQRRGARARSRAGRAERKAAVRRALAGDEPAEPIDEQPEPVDEQPADRPGVR